LGKHGAFAITRKGFLFAGNSQVHNLEPCKFGGEPGGSGATLQQTFSLASGSWAILLLRNKITGERERIIASCRLRQDSDRKRRGELRLFQQHCGAD
jgi:hypothetical protein